MPSPKSGIANGEANVLTRTVRRYLIALSVVVLLLALYSLAGFWAVPHFLRSGLSDFVRSHYGRTLSLGDIRFNPFSFTLDISDFSLPDRDGEPMLAFSRLHVDAQLKSLFKLGPSFREIVLERPAVRAVVRPDGTLNLADLGKGFATKPPPAPSAKSTEPMRLFIDRLAVTFGGATFEDLSHAKPFRADFKPITFELRNFNTRAKASPNDNNEYSLTAASPQGERIEWNGRILLEPVSSHGTFSVTDLLASTIWNYLQQPLPLDVPSGVVALKGEYNFDVAGEAPAVKLSLHETTVSDLKLRPRGGTTDYVVLGKLDVRETEVDLVRRALEIGKVSLTGGEVKAWLSPQGELNLLELMPPHAASPAAVPAPAQTTTPGASNASGLPSGPGAATPPPVWTVSAPDVNVNGFRISAEDRQLTPSFTLALSQLSLHVAGFNTTPAARLDVTARASINSGGTLSATAQLAPKGGDITAHVEIADLDLSMFQPFIAQRTAMTLTAGRLGSRLDVTRGGADGALAVKGDVDVTDLRSVDELQKTFIKWKDVRIAGLQYNLQPASLHIDSITARDPYARVIIAPDRTVNVQEVLAGPSKGTPSLATQLGAANARGATGISPAASSKAESARENAKASAGQANTKSAGTAAPPSAPAAKENRRSRGSRAEVAGAPAAAPPSPPMMPVSIGTVRIIDGSANYADFWIQPNFAVGIQTLNGSIDGLSSDPRSRARLKLDGKVDRYAPVDISGEMNLLAASVYSNIKMSFKGLELTTMTPYSGRFAGYKIDKGKLSVDVNYKIDHRVLTADQRFVIDQLQLGERVESPDAVHLPLKLAVALLKDRNGVINVPLPISGSLDDPQFKVGPIIWHAVVNLLERVATAPFAALGRLFGGRHGEDMKFIDFPAGSAELDDDSREKLSGLSKALQEHTQLQLDVPLAFSEDLDRPALAKRRLEQRLLARAHGETSPSGPARSSQGAAPASAPDPALADPLRHYRLLLAEYEAELGKDAQLPASAQAVQKSKNKQDASSVQSAIPDLEQALLDHIEVSDIMLQDLGKKRAQAIEDALLADGGIDASRVFVINGAARTDDDKVRVEMSLK